jgi:mannose-6-phosphate isomerase-like protein (cupin superfamily)
MEKAYPPHSRHHASADMALEPPSPVWVELLERCAARSHLGAQWAYESEDLDVTLLSWDEGQRIEAHHNLEVDVVLVGVEGTGVVSVDGKAHELRPGVLLLISKGCERAIESTSQRFSYLSLHQRRRGLMPVFNW